jgi:hypothetical protein
VEWRADSLEVTVEEFYIDFTLPVWRHFVLQLFGYAVSNSRGRVPTIDKHPNSLMSLEEKNGTEVHTAAKSTDAL